MTVFKTRITLYLAFSFKDELEQIPPLIRIILGTLIDIIV